MDARYYPSNCCYHVVGWFKNGRYYARPDQPTIQAFLFIIASAAQRYEVGISAWAMMSSHPHIDVFDLDPNGPSRVSKFKQFVNSCFAKWLNWYRASRGVVFDPNVTTQQIAVVDVRAERKTIAYIETNMLEAGILDEEGILEGAISKRDYLLAPIQVPRPEGWFQARTWPDVVELQLAVPPQAVEAGYTLETWWARTSIDVYEAKMHIFEEKARQGTALKDFKTPADILEEDPLKDRKTKVNYGIVHCTGTDKRAKAAFYRRKRRHVRVHGRRLDQIRSGDRDIEFPFGTCRMVLSLGFPMRLNPG